MNPNDKREKDVNTLIKSIGMFFAFSNEQFEQNKTPLKEGEKYIDIGMGGYIPKGNLDQYITGMNAIDDEFKNAMKDKKARRDHIAYELNNHEAYYTRSIESTMESLGEDFTREEVLTVFDGRKTIY